jgi:hypothetical protein
MNPYQQLAEVEEKIRKCDLIMNICVDVIIWTAIFTTGFLLGVVLCG